MTDFVTALVSAKGASWDLIQLEGMIWDWCEVCDILNILSHTSELKIDVQDGDKIYICIKKVLIASAA